MLYRANGEVRGGESMQRGPERPVAVPVEAPPRAKWRTFALAVITLAGLTLCGAVVLVLTGIIAEPETLIEQILRALTGN